MGEIKRLPWNGFAHQTGYNLCLNGNVYGQKNLGVRTHRPLPWWRVQSSYCTHKRISRDDSSSSEPDELYRRKVGTIGWAVLGLRFDVSFTHKELSRVFDQYNEYAERVILQRNLAYLIRTKDARILMDSRAMHNYKPPPTRR